MNTTIIDKILIHMLDHEHNNVIFSDSFIDLEHSSLEYYDKKIEKCLKSTNIKELITGSQHHLLTMAHDMILDDESFLINSKIIAQELFDVCKKIEEMPNSNLIFIECKVNGFKKLLIIKVNYKLMPISVIEEVDGKQMIRFSSKQCLPPQSAAVDEAIMIDLEEDKISLIEKRYTIDGKAGYYLNDQYIKGEPKLTDKQKMSIVNKVVKKVDSEYHVFDGEPQAAVKKELIELIMDHKPVKPLEVAKKVVGNDYNASEEVETIMKDLGIDEDDEIVNIPISLDRMSRCKLVLDDDRIIELNVEDYMNSENMETRVNEDGLTSITLNNISEIKMK